jgi:uncharacterized protein
MELSRFNIVSQLKDSDEYFIVNALYGSADIVDGNVCRGLLEGKLINDEFTDRGYLVDPRVEKDRFREAYLRFLDNRETDELQLFFVPWYDCNFDCSYCYQGEYELSGRGVSTAVIDAFFEYIDSAFSQRTKYITLFGGEPLLPGKFHRAMISYLAVNAAKRGIEIAVVTNGYHVADYFDILEMGNIREVQVTIDGPGEVHNKRRYLKNGRGSFDRIVEGVDLLLDHGIPLNLRVVLDRDNIGSLPGLARFAIDRGWTAAPGFSTQLGRNYELHECQANSDRLYSRIGMYAELYRMIKEHPEILEFHRPSFSVSRALYESGEIPSPLFDACPGATTEWAFDYTGKIYACTATVGKKGEELGTFFPERVLDQDKIDSLADRDVLSIKECHDCNLSLLCGGGCAAVARNRHGSIQGPDCRPVKELLELGLSAYFK